MSGKILALISLLLSATLTQGASIPFAEAGKHVGEEVTVTGKVSRVSTIPSGMTFVNFGTRGANDAFTAVAKPGVADGGKLKEFEGKEVEVAGTIELYKGSPQIVIRSAEDIRLPGAAPADDKPAPEEKPERVAANPGYEISTFEVPLEKKEARSAGKTPEGDYPEKAIVAIAHPPGFEPKEGQRLLIVITDFITGPEHERLLKPYLKVAEQEGLFVISARGSAIDSKLSLEWYPVMLQAAIRHLSTDYPKLKDWPVYLAGKGDGAKFAGAMACALIKDDFQVRGCYLASLRNAEFGEAIDTFRPSRADMRELKVFVAHGTGDRLVTKETSLKQTELIREAGLKEVRHEMNDGWGGAEAGSLDAAIRWFDEPR